MKKLSEAQIEAFKLGRVKGLKKPRTGLKKEIIPWNKGLKGIHLSPSSEFQKGELYGVQFKKGNIPWNKGKVFSLNKFLLENVNEYKALHKRINRRFIKTGKCELCEDDKYTEWASKTFNYTENRFDWLELCRSCHNKHDRKFANV